MKIAEIIRELRCDKGISQEILADVCGVSMQAVSKWENGQSCPDITFVPLLAEYFGVSIDYLLTGRNHAAENIDNDFVSNLSKQELEDDVLYIIQYRNGKILDKTQWDKERLENKDTTIRIQFADESAHLPSGLHVEVWGNADIEAPDVNMNVNAGGNVNCGNVYGNISAGASVNCDVVEGSVSAGNSVNCNTIESCVSAGNNVSCDTIEGDAAAACISCNIIEGDAKAGTQIEYKKN
ncbi:MAG: helix-turn-helix domain-containing protein [Lachnospiraceae bacterium]|nr:helix-turn-helix domain-containing protein [Lachnospiraceae bacterium]MDE7416705.1 helix-turn-helix domain-containing protein [Lachnospiraceae bacterium]